MNFNYIATKDGEPIAYFQNYDDAKDFSHSNHSLTDVEIGVVVSTLNDKDETINNCYLVDFENIGKDKIKELVNVSEGDKVIIFYTERCNGITLDMIETITNSNAKLSCCKVKTGTKNALDFQLASYLGFLISKEEYAKYYIVSNDKGYDCLCDYWKEQGVDKVQIIRNESETIKVTETETIKVTETIKAPKNNIATIDEIKKLLSNDDKPEEVLKIFNQYKTKLAIHNNLVKHFKENKRASAIYKKLKPLLKEKNKS